MSRSPLCKVIDGPVAAGLCVSDIFYLIGESVRSIRIIFIFMLRYDDLRQFTYDS